MINYLEDSLDYQPDSVREFWMSKLTEKIYLLAPTFSKAETIVMLVEDYLIDLQATEPHITKQALINAFLRLEIEENNLSMGDLLTAIVKQIRHTFIAYRGIDSIPEYLIPNSELEHKWRILTECPSSKSEYLPTLNLGDY